MNVELTVPADRGAAYRNAGLWDGRLLGDGIEAAAAACPDAPALTDDGRQLTWSELQGASAGAAGELAGAAVVLVTGNTTDGAVAFHGALRAGAPVLLLDRRVGPADVAFALDAVPGPVRLVLPEAERERLAPPGSDVLALERVAGSVATPWSEPDRDAPAVVLLTSGTTGTPKAVVHSINTLTASAANMAHFTGCTTEDVLFLVSPLASITGVMQLLLAADQHASIVLTDRFEPARTLDRLDEVGATLLGGAPVVAERLLQAAVSRGSDHIALRALALGGAMLPRPLLDLAAERFGLEIVRMYGSSEAPVFTGSLPTDDAVRRLADDGQLPPGNEIKVGSSGHPEEGMLRGPGVFLGYLDPTDNAAAFEDGWYRTGDLVEVRDCRLTVTGRLKEVVNRNGIKISPAEVDQALESMTGVAEHACFGVPDAETGERLAVAIHAAPGATVTLTQVIDHLLAAGVSRRKLPEQLLRWDEPLPRTASGKVVRSQLAMEAPAKPTELVDRLRPPTGR